MPNPMSMTIVLGETERDCRSVLPEGDSGMSIVPMIWPALELGAPEGMALDAVLCQVSPILARRSGLLAILRRAYPDTPFFSFSSFSQHSVEGPDRESLSLGLDAHLVVPIASENLRTLIEREARLRTLARRYRETLGRVREQSEKLDLLIETAK